MHPALVTHDTVKDRDLYFLSVGEARSLPDSISLPCEKFAVFLAFDATGLNHAEIAPIAQALLRAGAVYLCCYGPDCERVHDIIDEELLQSTLDQRDASSVVMTTWHSDDPLEDALLFFVFNSYPDDEYFDACKAGLAISIHPSWGDRIIRGLRDLTAAKSPKMTSNLTD